VLEKDRGYEIAPTTNSADLCILGIKKSRLVLCTNARKFAHWVLEGMYVMRIRNTHLAYPRPAVEGISNCYRGHGYVQRGSASSYSTCVHVSVNWRCTCTNMRECRVLGSMSRCSFDLQCMNTVCMSCCRIQIDPKQFSQFCRKSITGRISMSLRSSSLGALRFSPTLTLDLNLHVASVNPPTLIIHHSTYFMCC
jgi:hypothetical protein